MDIRVPSFTAKKILIENPPNGGARFTSPDRAARFVRNGRAIEVRPNVITFTFLGTPRSSQSASLPTVERYSGPDALPSRAVLPPSPAVLARMGTPGKPVRPPLGERP